MRVVDVHRSYDIVETNWTTEDPATGKLCSVYVIPGLKERPNRPYLTTVQEAREYIDDELDGREAWAQESVETFTAQARAHGRSVAVTIPSHTARRLDIEAGDEVEVTIKKARWTTS